MRFTRLAATGLLAIAASCGGSSPTSNSGNPPPPPPPPVGGANVGIKDFSFSPETVTVKVGASVQWVNNGPSSHHVVSDDGVWDAGNLAPPSGDDGTYGGSTGGQTFTFKFTTAGTYNYHCSNHPLSAYPNFKGVVVVTP
ncbi:MAG TPA: plastocyanin/azurin family copper-binding protein [Gemmatimonadaceae bacterium]